MRCTVVNLLQSFHLHGSRGSLFGLIKLEVRYFAWFGHAFKCLETAEADKYNPHMLSNPAISKSSQRDSVFEAGKDRSLLVSTVNCSARLFVLSLIEETWVSNLKYAAT